MAAKHVPVRSRVLDIGCADGLLGRVLRSRIVEYVGMDPDLEMSEVSARCSLKAGVFPLDLPDSQPFDIIIMLAVIEHIPPSEQQTFSQDCARYLRIGGRLILTVPLALVDPIFAALIRVGIADGMSLDEHYHFDPSMVPSVFLPHGFGPPEHQRFQFGLNNPFVFVRL